MVDDVEVRGIAGHRVAVCTDDDRITLHRVDDIDCILDALDVRLDDQRVTGESRRGQYLGTPRDLRGDLVA
jgi:hypothetical protein